MYGGLGDDVGVQAVAKIDGVDVVTGAKLACAQQDANKGGQVCRSCMLTTVQMLLTILNRCT